MPAAADEGYAHFLRNQLNGRVLTAQQVFGTHVIHFAPGVGMVGIGRPGLMRQDKALPQGLAVERGEAPAVSLVILTGLPQPAPQVRGEARIEVGHDRVAGGLVADHSPSVSAATSDRISSIVFSSPRVVADALSSTFARLGLPNLRSISS